MLDHAMTVRCVVPDSGGTKWPVIGNSLEVQTLLLGEEKREAVAMSFF
jgi:hypothetical protein